MDEWGSPSTNLQEATDRYAQARRRLAGAPAWRSRRAERELVTAWRVYVKALIRHGVTYRPSEHATG